MENLSDRIVVLSKGELHYSGSIKELVKTSSRGTEFRFENIDETKISKLISYGVGEVVDQRESSLSLLSRDIGDSGKMFSICSDNNIIPVAVEPYRRSLEDILYGKKGGAE